jgi:hypothetical protein
MPVKVTINPNQPTAQAAIIPNATERTDGVMTAAMVRQLNGGGGGGGGATVYADFAAFPDPPDSGATQVFAIAADTRGLYCSFNDNWCFIVILTPAV